MNEIRPGYVIVSLAGGGVVSASAARAAAYDCCGPVGWVEGLRQGDGKIYQVTAHESRTTSAQMGIEPRRYFLGASVDPTEARCGVRV
jgi:hypothetical protein